MIDTGKATALSLLETGTLVPFRVVDTDTGLTPDKENVFVRADLVCNFVSSIRLTVADFFGSLSFKHGELRLETDYVRGRSMKTDATICPNGSVTLTTRGRGVSAVRWLDQLLGKKRIAPVPTPD